MKIEKIEEKGVSAASSGKDGAIENDFSEEATYEAGSAGQR